VAPKRTSRPWAWSGRYFSLFAARSPNLLSASTESASALRQAGEPPARKGLPGRSIAGSAYAHCSAHSPAQCLSHFLRGGSGNSCSIDRIYGTRTEHPKRGTSHRLCNFSCGRKHTYGQTASRCAGAGCPSGVSMACDSRSTRRLNPRWQFLKPLARLAGSLRVRTLNRCAGTYRSTCAITANADVDGPCRVRRRMTWYGLFAGENPRLGSGRLRSNCTERCGSTLRRALCGGLVFAVNEEIDTAERSRARRGDGVRRHPAQIVRGWT